MNTMTRLVIWCVVFLVIGFSNALNVKLNTKYASSLGRKEVTLRCKTIKLKHGRTRYRQKSGFLQSTCDTGYILAGDKYMKCQNGQWEGVLPMCVRDTCKMTREPANGFVYPSHRGGVLNFFCKPGYELSGPPTAFCDGSNWSTHLPICTQSNKTVSVTCDFENPDICGWTHDLNHNFDWIRHNRETPSAFIGTGPSYDHTLGVNKGGYYMYIEASRKNPYDTARLISPVHRAQENRTCLQFWYHMYGATMGELRVYVQHMSRLSWTFDGTDSLWTRNGNHGNRWLRGFVDLGIMADDFQVIFEAVRGGNYMSDTALDDIKLIENCEGWEEGDTTSTTEETSTDDGQEYLQSWSCYNRCDRNLTDYASYPCSCLLDCYDQQTCCPDYEAYCLDDTTSSSLDSSTLGEEEESISDDQEPTNTSTTAPSQRNEIIDDAIDSMSTTGQDASFEDQDILEVANSKPSTLKPATTTLKATTTVRKTQPMITKPTVGPTFIPTVKLTTKPPLKLITTPVTISPLRPPAIKSKTKDKKLQVQENEVLRTSETNKEQLAIKSPVTKQMAKAESGLSMLAVTVIGATIMVALVVLVVGVRMRRRVVSACQSMRMRRGMASDSQSDVRFLTSDEILDFSLASSTL